MISKFENIDEYITTKISKINSPLLKYFSNLHIIFDFVSLSLILIYFNDPNKKKLIVTVIVYLIIVYTFKTSLNRSRPRESKEYSSIFNSKFSLFEFYNRSFPSGHVASCVIFSSLFGFDVTRIFPYIMGLSRINVGAHYFSDVVVSIILFPIVQLIVKKLI